MILLKKLQDYLNDFYDILSEKIFNVDKDKHRLEIKKEYVESWIVDFQEKDMSNGLFQIMEYLLIS